MKICRICQQDCSTKARVRDPEGNYYCRPCFDERKAAEAHEAQVAAAPVMAAEAAAVAAGEDPGLAIEDEGYGLADLMGDIGPGEEGSSMCPECGYAMRAGAALCVHCGYDPVKGKAMRTAVKGPERDPEEAEYAAKRARAASAAAMTPVRMVTCSAIAGLVVAGAWMLVAYSLHADFRGMAILAGLLIGAGTIKGARGDCGPLVGLTAALVALVAILGGRFGAISMIIDDDVKMLQSELVSEEVVLLFLAEDVADEWEKEGRDIDWPLGVRPESIESEYDCSPELWDATTGRWTQMTTREQEDYTYEIDDLINEYLVVNSGLAKEEMFADNFNIFFLATLVVGVVVAFGMGMWGDDLPM